MCLLGKVERPGVSWDVLGCPGGNKTDPINGNILADGKLKRNDPSRSGSAVWLSYPIQECCVS